MDTWVFLGNTCKNAKKWQRVFQTPMASSEPWFPCGGLRLHRVGSGLLSPSSSSPVTPVTSPSYWSNHLDAGNCTTRRWLWWPDPLCCAWAESSAGRPSNVDSGCQTHSQIWGTFEIDSNWRCTYPQGGVFPAYGFMMYVFGGKHHLPQWQKGVFWAVVQTQVEQGVAHSGDLLQEPYQEQIWKKCHHRCSCRRPQYPQPGICSQHPWGQGAQLRMSPCNSCRWSLSEPVFEWQHVYNAPRQLGKFHPSLNRCTMFLQVFSVGTGMYWPLSCSQISRQVSLTITATMETLRRKLEAIITKESPVLRNLQNKIIK